MSDLLGELQSYCDERARRWAVNKERATQSMDKLVAHTKMTEALAISEQIARMIKRGQG